MNGRKKYTLQNPLMFSFIMQDRNRCIGLIERIFPGRKVQELNFVCQDDQAQSEPEIERTYVMGIDKKSIRMDVLFEDNSAWYDIEMQVRNMGNLPQRSRYYHAVKTVDSMKRGGEYKNLKEGYVIFINEFDMFGLDEPVYSFQMFDENLQLILNDGQHTIFLNSTCRNNVPTELEGFYHYLQTGEVREGDDWLTEMAAAVEDANSRKEVLDKVTVYDEIEMLENMLKSAKHEYEAAKQEHEAVKQEHEAVKQEYEVVKQEYEVQAEELAAKDRFSTLTLLLVQQGRADEILRAAEDESYRDKLFAEFGLE